MSHAYFGALVLAAVSVGSLHSLAPDHWVPFAAVLRAPWLDRHGDAAAGGLIVTVGLVVSALGW